MSDKHKTFNELSEQETLELFERASDLIVRFDNDIALVDMKRSLVLAAWTGYDAQLVTAMQVLMHFTAENKLNYAQLQVDFLLLGAWLARNKPEEFKP